MKKNQAKVVLAFADSDMNISGTGRKLFLCRSTILWYLDAIKRDTGLDPRRFYELIKLVDIAKRVLAA